jgi:hypothetical protein
MANKTKQPKRVSIIKLIVFTMWASIMGIIGVSLPKTINFINGLSETAFYGNFASYAVSIILFWLFMRDYSLMTERESHFKMLRKLFQRMNRNGYLTYKSEDLRTKK